MRKSVRLTVLALVGAVSLFMFAAVASADNINFHSASASVDNNGNLVCSFFASGLGNTTTSADVSCTADASATYACINGGGNHPKAANKATFSGPVGNSGTFPVRNGQVRGSITVAPPSAGDFSCPGGQRLVLASVSYTNVVITVEGSSQPVSGTFSRTLVDV
jgi:hypothetical protein